VAHRFTGRLSAGVFLAFAFSSVLPLAGPLAAPLAAQEAVKGLATESATLPGLPAIGLWMLARDGSVADWLGAPCQGKKLLEPINVIIVDRFAASMEDAVSRLKAASEKTEFDLREGHSSGYSALIGGQAFPQFPAGTEETFSDAPFTLNNNHGRIFGPIEWEGSYVFTGAFSRENVDIVTKVKHQFASFDRARDAFSQKFSAKTEYRLSSFVYLGNDFPDDPSITTGDHDGMAVLLAATK
jgi:hypothetical protein